MELLERLGDSATGAGATPRRYELPLSGPWFLAIGITRATGALPTAGSGTDSVASIFGGGDLTRNLQRRLSPSLLGIRRGPLCRASVRPHNGILTSCEPEAEYEQADRSG
jgi:hypothetical protein